MDDQGGNIARLAVLQSGFPASVPGVSLNRMCGSSQQAVHFAAQAILSGDMELVLAGGIEMMSHQPLGQGLSRGVAIRHAVPVGPSGHFGRVDGGTLGAEPRQSLDDFAFESHVRAGGAIETGRSRTRSFH